MLKVNKMHILQLVIFVSAFVYRLYLMTWQTYPPGADIGCHTSIIQSITNSENTNLMYNYYQMGGGTTLGFPGYHIFASLIISTTGMPSYLAQAIIATIFSAVIILCTFLVTRRIWNEPVGIIASFFVTVTRFDIEMLTWGGYPNITGLLLIPLIYYVILKKNQFSLASFLTVTSILISSLFLAHSLSSAIFVCTLGLTLFVVLVFPKLFNETRKNTLTRALPLFIGALIVSPFLAVAAPLYLNDSATFAGATAIIQVLLADRMVPFSIVLAIFECIVSILFFSRKYKRPFFSFPVFLFFIWLLVPLLLTQGYLVGFYVDYVRFLYFLSLPLMVVFAVMTDFASGFISSFLSGLKGLTVQNKKTGQFFNKILSGISKINRKTFYVAFLVFFWGLWLFYVPILLFPWEGVQIQGFYQSMNNQGYQGIEWVKQNTPMDSVFVSDHDYGWWLGGFSPRPTIASVNLQSLALAREVNISKNASYLLDTNYMIDNGYIQVKEDGGHIGRHNPIFLAGLNWDDSAHGFFHFNSSENILFVNNSTAFQSVSIAELPVISMQLVNANTDSPAVVVKKANSDFSYSQTVTVTKGCPFANLTITVQSNKSNVSLDCFEAVLYSQSLVNQSFSNSLVLLDPDKNLFGQLIFAKNIPQIGDYELGNCSLPLLSYDLQSESEVEIQMLVGIYDIPSSNSQNQMSPSDFVAFFDGCNQNFGEFLDLPLTTFDYEVALLQYNVSYVANRDFEVNPKFVNDPKFDLVFKNGEVSIFQVNPDFNSTKRITQDIVE